jgi:hypothetical protein
VVVAPRTNSRLDPDFLPVRDRRPTPRRPAAPPARPSSAAASPAARPAPPPPRARPASATPWRAGRASPERRPWGAGAGRAPAPRAAELPAAAPRAAVMRRASGGGAEFAVHELAPAGRRRAGTPLDDPLATLVGRVDALLSEVGREMWY